MITGSVNAHREPILRLTVRGAAGQELEVEGVIDTGFSGSISLPSALNNSVDGLSLAGLLEGSPVGDFDVHTAGVYS
jgi:predicted aspartyl protease